MGTHDMTGYADAAHTVGGESMPSNGAHAVADPKPYERDADRGGDGVLDWGEPSGAMFANGIPIYYQLQLQAQMAVTGTRHAALLVLHHADSVGLKLRAYYMPRHDPVVQRIRSEAIRFVADLEKLKAGLHE